MTSRLPGFSDGGSRALGASRMQSSSSPLVEEAELPDNFVNASFKDTGFVRPTSATVQVTADMVDEAVEKVVRDQGLGADIASVLMFNLGKDVNQGPAHAYYVSQAASRAKLAGVSRREITIKYAMVDEDVTALMEYAPEYKLNFLSSDSHDHPMAAASRLIDHNLIKARIPPNLPYSDIGGNPLVHVKSGDKRVHVCGPILDVKDQMRHTLRRMRAQKMASTSDNPTTVKLANAYLRGDPEFVCDKLAQDCDHQSQVLTAIHVYDIPIRDWPAIMEKKGASLVEGCMLFSDKFFDSVEGKLGVSKARYKINVRDDTFQMGFEDSPSWWYQHSWTQFMLYGADQLIRTDTAAYSYKIVERRGDTIFFRILRIESPGPARPMSWTRRSPGIPLVEVNGFEIAKRASYTPLSRRTYRFPRNLWYEMVTQASEDYERGVLDFDKMYNHYRTISVRQTINAVLIMGGETVEADELVPLVTHACLAAAAQSMLGQRVTRGLTDEVIRTRARQLESLSRKVTALLGAVVWAPWYSLSRMFQSITRDFMFSYENWVLDWEPVARNIEVQAHEFKSVRGVAGPSQNFQDAMRDAAALTAVQDHFSTVMADPRLRAVFCEVQPDVAKEEGLERDSDEASITAPPTYVTEEERVSSREQRKAAIREHILEIQLQNRAITSSCHRVYREVTLHAKPNSTMLKKKAELHRNPDLWEVVNGVITKSALGVPAQDFSHSAIYSPQPDPDTGEYIRSVTVSEWHGKSHSGQPLHHTNHVLGDSNFSGWVLVTDDLHVHNGPEIVSSMQLALDLPHDYDIRLLKAPPGSGKTYTIVHEAVSDGTDVIMCPVRESITSTREDVLRLHPNFPDPKLRVRTVDSYLTNLALQDKTGNLRCSRLLADECFMTHSGKWYAIAALLGVREVLAYGDDKQIPHIPRVEAPKQFVKLVPDKIDYVWTTRRCPNTAVAAWGSVYNWRVRSLSKEVDAPLDEVRTTVGREVPGGCVMMCMYQADKLPLRQMYASHLRHIRIITSHESEGKTYEHVWLHRFDNRRRSDKFSLFDQEPHVLVAMSRHTKSFLYSCPGDLGDLVSTWVARSKDPRRRAAALDLASAGSELEKL